MEGWGAMDMRRELKGLAWGLGLIRVGVRVGMKYIKKPNRYIVAGLF